VSSSSIGQEAGEWLQQATLAIRALVVIQPFSTFSEAFLHALTDLESQTAARPRSTVHTAPVA
jgi:hypothetical protein